MTSSQLCAEFLEFAALDLRRLGGRGPLPACDPHTCSGLRHLQDLAEAVAVDSGRDAADLLRRFGTALFPSLVRRYPAFLVGIASTTELVSRFDAHVGAEVAKLAPGIRLPTLMVVARKGRALDIAYRSPDGLADLAEGLLRGSVRHFGERLAIGRLDRPERDACETAFALRPEAAVSRRAASPVPSCRPPPRV